MQISILDIAKKAGVSKSTVSRVLNGGPVNRKTKDLVEETIKEMGYTPNFMARGLRGIQNKVVGVLSIGKGMFTNPTISRRVAGISDTLYSNNCDLMIVQDALPQNNSGHVPKYVRYMREGRIQGLITLGWDDLPEVQKAANEFRNVVYGGERQHITSGFRVYHGNYNYSCDLYRLLFSNGHKKVLTTVGFDPVNEQFRNTRINAYKSSCMQFGINGSEKDFYDSPVDENLSEEYMEDLYKVFCKGKYTAIFADEMQHAEMILGYFKEKGLCCPEDFSLVTIKRDESEEKFITSAYVSDYSYGVMITKLMLEVLKNKDLEYQDIMMSYSIEVRKSVGKA